MVSTLRGVLRYLHGSGRMPIDLVDVIEGPPIYALEGIPSTIATNPLMKSMMILGRIATKAVTAATMQAGPRRSGGRTSSGRSKPLVATGHRRAVATTPS